MTRWPPAQPPAPPARLRDAPALALTAVGPPAAPVSPPHPVLEWTGHGWTFPGLGHYTDVLEGPITRLRIDRPGTLRLTGHGDALRIELIPDTRAGATTPIVGLPLPSQLLAVPDTDDAQARTPRPSAPQSLARPYAAGLVLIAMLAGAAFFTGSRDTVPTTRAQTPPPSLTCVAGTSGCEATAGPEMIPPAPGLFDLMIPSGLDTPTSAIDTDASTPRMNPPPPGFFAVTIPPDPDTTVLLQTGS